MSDTQKGRRLLDVAVIFLIEKHNFFPVYFTEM